MKHHYPDWLREIEKNRPKTPPLNTFEIIQRFRARFPDIDYSKFDGQTMKRILDGDLVIVRHRGERRFSVWTREDIEAGKLDDLNDEIMEMNRETRELNRRRKARVQKEAKELCREIGLDQFEPFRNIFK